MYGTIFNLKVKPGHEEQLLATLTNDRVPTPQGMVAWFVMEPDQDHDWIGVAIFDTKESHVNNSERPEQHEWFLEVMTHLEEEPTWTDGVYVVGKMA